MTASRPPGSRPFGVGHARRGLAAADAFVERAHDLLAAPERLRARAVVQLAEAKSAQVERLLEAVSVTALDVAGRGARIGGGRAARRSARLG